MTATRIIQTEVAGIRILDVRESEADLRRGDFIITERNDGSYCPFIYEVLEWDEVREVFSLRQSTMQEAQAAQQAALSA